MILKSGFSVKNIAREIKISTNPSKAGAAEEVGFEPTVRGYPTTVFKTAALSRSATPPKKATRIRASILIDAVPVPVKSKVQVRSSLCWSKLDIEGGLGHL